MKKLTSVAVYFHLDILRSLVSIQTVTEPDLISMERNGNFATSGSDRFCLKLII